MRAKNTLYEESAGIPLMMAGPDVPAGKVISDPVTLADIFPTVLECVGVKPAQADADLPGASLLAGAARGSMPQRTVLSEYHAASSPSGAFMIRHGRFKYIHYTGYAPMLFDLANDPHERHDLSGDSAHKADLEACEAALRNLLDPEAVDRRARGDQTAMIEKLGGKDAVLGRGAIRHSPPPGVKATRIAAERG